MIAQRRMRNCNSLLDTYTRFYELGQLLHPVSSYGNAAYRGPIFLLYNEVLVYVAQSLVLAVFGLCVLFVSCPLASPNI